jgi:anti-sigma factor RsiW
MTACHLTQDILHRFLRAELSRRENQLVVRHLLTRCPACLGTLQEADRTVGLRLTAMPRSAPPVHLAGRMG